MQKEKLVRKLIALLVNDKVIVESIILKYEQCLIKWCDQTLEAIEEEWDVEFRHLFTHFQFTCEQQLEFLVTLIFDCAGHHVRLEDNYDTRQLMISAREYFDKPLPERPILIDFTLDGLIVDILEEFQVED